MVLIISKYRIKRLLLLEIPINFLSGVGELVLISSKYEITFTPIPLRQVHSENSDANFAGPPGSGGKIPEIINSLLNT
jgi:hypothetical protein